MSNLYLQPGNRKVRQLPPNPQCPPPNGYKHVLIPYNEIEMKYRRTQDRYWKQAHVVLVRQTKLTEKPVRQSKKNMELIGVNQ